MTNSLKIKQDIILESEHKAAKILVDTRYVQNKLKKPVIIFIHGFKGFKDWGTFNLVANEMAQAGYVYVKLNLSHNGTTVDNPTEYGNMEAFSENNFSIELDDIGTVIDYLHSAECDIDKDEMDLERLFLIGHSRGGGLAILKTYEDDRIRAVATWASVADFKFGWPDHILEAWKKEGVFMMPNSRTKQDMPMKYQIVEDFYANEERLSIPNAAKNLKKAFLIIHGTNDETVPHTSALMLHESCPHSELLLIDNANHVFGGAHPYEHNALPEDTKTAVARTIQFFSKFAG